MNWDDPAARFAYIEAHGPDAYNRAFAEHQAASVVVRVNGYAIQPVQSRFGRLFLVVGTSKAFGTLDEAKRHAEAL